MGHDSVDKVEPLWLLMFYSMASRLFLALSGRMAENLSTKIEAVTQINATFC